MAPAIPDRWIPYKACGEVIEGTRIVCFKVPLRPNVQTDKPEITEIWDIKALLKKVPKLGVVIDLTNTSRYYDPTVLKSAGVKHKKILMPGRIMPPEAKVTEFMNFVDEFLKSNKESIVGVHCTHGLNRTGYMVCRYMRDRLGIDAKEAIKRFELARGYQIERENYIADLLKRFVPAPDIGKKTIVKAVRQNNDMTYKSPLQSYEDEEDTRGSYSYNRHARNRNISVKRSKSRDKSPWGEGRNLRRQGTNSRDGLPRGRDTKEDKSNWQNTRSNERTMRDKHSRSRDVHTSDKRTRDKRSNSEDRRSRERSNRNKRSNSRDTSLRGKNVSDKCSSSRDGGSRERNIRDCLNPKDRRSRERNVRDKRSNSRDRNIRDARSNSKDKNVRDERSISRDRRSRDRNISVERSNSRDRSSRDKNTRDARSNSRDRRSRANRNFRDRQTTDKSSKNYRRDYKSFSSCKRRDRKKSNSSYSSKSSQEYNYEFDY